MQLKGCPRYQTGGGVAFIWVHLDLLVEEVLTTLMSELHTAAENKSLSKEWEEMVTPWLKGQGKRLELNKNAELRSISVAMAMTDENVSSAPPSGGGVAASATKDMKPKVEDLVTTKISEDPWQYKPFDSASATWQAAAQRRHQHRRRTNALLGIASVDLSGPHEPTPMVGGKIGQQPGHYFLALTINVEEGISCREQQTQTEESAPPAGGAVPVGNVVDCPSELPTGGGAGKRSPLIYAEILSGKADAPAAVKHLIARVRDDHGHVPAEVIFRIHSDKGSEFVNADLEKYCNKMGRRQTHTAGYDPSASGENAIGYLKRKSRQLLTGSRLTTRWWGVSSYRCILLKMRSRTRGMAEDTIWIQSDGCDRPTVAKCFHASSSTSNGLRAGTGSSRGYDRVPGQQAQGSSEPTIVRA